MIHYNQQTLRGRCPASFKVSKQEIREIRKGRTKAMMKLMMPALGAVGVAAVACGCYSPKVAYRNYPTTAFAEVALKNNATIRIASVGESPASDALMASLRDSFAKSKQFKVTDGKADYWMIVNGIEEVRVDTPAELPFTEKVEVVSVGAKDDQPGPAHEELAAKRQASRTHCKGVSVAIYEAETLTPLHYFEIPVYDGVIKVEGGAKVATREELDKDLSEQIVGRVKDVFVTQTKDIQTPVPDEASPAMKSAMAGKDVATAVSVAAKSVIPQPFEEFLKDVQVGKYADDKGGLTTKLSDYYVQAIALEIGCLDAKVLKKLHARQVAILQNSTTDSLALACPVALARLEYKLANLGAK